MTHATRIALVAVAAGVLLTTPGCGALVVGYLVGDAIQKNKAVETCRNNLNATNQARIAKGQEPFPDQCAK